MSLQQFEEILATLVNLGKLKRRGDLYFWAEDL
jgi:hypothetical protein